MFRHTAPYPPISPGLFSCILPFRTPRFTLQATRRAAQPKPKADVAPINAAINRFARMFPIFQGCLHNPLPLLRASGTAKAPDGSTRIQKRPVIGSVCLRRRHKEERQWQREQ